MWGGPLLIVVPPQTIASVTPSVEEGTDLPLGYSQLVSIIGLVLIDYVFIRVSSLGPSQGSFRNVVHLILTEHLSPLQLSLDNPL